jgi:uncharacterized protein (TIGR00106 family)
MKMIAEFSILPVGKGESLSPAVAKIVKLVAKSGLDYQLTAMGTIVEGEPKQVWRLLEKCHQSARRDARRVLTSIRIDDRAGAKNRIAGKVRAVERKLGSR